jgi:hypothetical protein
MKLERDTAQALVQYLIAHGYPPESLLQEYAIGRYRADVVIVDSKSYEPIALFEIKQNRNSDTITMGKTQIKKFLSSLTNKSIPTYLVFSTVGTPPFEIERVYLDVAEKSEKGNDASIAIPDFAVLQKSGNTNLGVQTNKEWKQYINIIFWICIPLAVVLIVLLCLDAIGKIFITSTQLTIGAVIIALILIPFANKVRILGIEFEKLRKDK